MLRKSLIIFCFVNHILCYAQQQDSLVFKNGIDRPSILATHHFGIFSARINNNFKQLPSKKNALSINYTSGNNFHPFVEAYLPRDPVVREQQRQKIWYQRDFVFENQETTPADYMNIVIDAIIKEFRVNYNITLNKKSELNITLRSYLISNGKYPFSFFTSDESIEWFHSNIAGGEDPFGRRYYGLNQVNFRYLDRNGRTLELNTNDFFIGGLELNHFYYPNFLRNKDKHIYTNIGSHLGINTSRFNSALDYGVSINSIKQLVFKSQNILSFGLGGSVLHKNFLNFKNSNIDLGNNRLLASFEGHIEFTKYTKKGNYNAFGINYHIQSRFNKKEEAGYYRLLGKWREINGGWHNGVATLYNTLSDWTAIYTYATPTYKLSLFCKQDLEVNNAPDFQTGISLILPFGNK
ncbi:hypothetical protein [Hyunsoonleella pacifica]|uniref:Uncharacterized protein n=1 Tax=Hyunsoonleella pacifica TaxID=1080224 RepID=A0A4Q9FKU1_9FLAO|nr:hypothetical protein [Hyunsoonleella pacifica]TBN14303.1 hypothetical protein EYD46_12055 [Hyunsoonleella pacifica]GGD12636.1 hypothetical protein GCM10011368_13270 [Hyunsoonleella pacifica]